MGKSQEKTNKRKDKRKEHRLHDKLKLKPSSSSSSSPLHISLKKKKQKRRRRRIKSNGNNSDDSYSKIRKEKKENGTHVKETNDNDNNNNIIKKKVTKKRGEVSITRILNIQFGKKGSVNKRIHIEPFDRCTRRVNNIAKNINSVNRNSKKATEGMIAQGEEYAANIISKALNLSIYAGRKQVSPKDIISVIETNPSLLLPIIPHSVRLPCISKSAM
jgi:histone H3/H4